MTVSSGVTNRATPTSQNPPNTAEGAPPTKGSGKTSGSVAAQKNQPGTTTEIDPETGAVILVPTNESGLSIG